MYLAQGEIQGEMVRGTTGRKTDQESQVAKQGGDRIECGGRLHFLPYRAPYVRARPKEDNTVNLLHALVGLHNNYDLDGIDAEGQATLNPLAACYPQMAPPFTAGRLRPTGYICGAAVEEFSRTNIRLTRALWFLVLVI